MEENNHIYPIFDRMLMRKDKESSKETFVPIFDSIHKNNFLSWKQSDRTEKSSCIVMTE